MLLKSYSEENPAVAIALPIRSSACCKLKEAMLDCVLSLFLAEVALEEICRSDGDDADDVDVDAVS